MTPMLLNNMFDELVRWLDAGCPKHSIFRRDTGVCFTVNKWCEVKGHDEQTRLSLQNWLTQRFRKDDYEDDVYPFNAGSADDYNKEHLKDVIWQNEARLSFVRNKGGYFGENA